MSKTFKVFWTPSHVDLVAFFRINGTNLHLLMEMMETFELKQLTNNNVITQDIPCFYFFFDIKLRSDQFIHCCCTPCNIIYLFLSYELSFSPFGGIMGQAQNNPLIYTLSRCNLFRQTSAQSQFNCSSAHTGSGPKCTIIAY